MVVGADLLVPPLHTPAPALPFCEQGNGRLVHSGLQTALPPFRDPDKLSDSQYWPPNPGPPHLEMLFFRALNTVPPSLPAPDLPRPGPLTLQCSSLGV